MERDGKRMKKLSMFMALAVLISSMSGLLTACAKGPKKDIDEEKAKFDSMRTVTFGNYKGEDIEWVVLENGDYGMLLLSKYAIDYRPYECTDVKKSWEYAMLRTWLNEEFFYEAFSDEEQEKILWHETEVYDNVTESNREVWSIPGAVPLERVFLLEIDEIEQYYENTLPTCYCEPTSYAKTLGAAESNVQWWMRGPCEIRNDTREGGTQIPAVDGNTVPSAHNYSLYYEEEGVKCGIRPAILVDLNGTAKYTTVPTEPIATVSPETSVTSDGLYVYTVYPGTAYEQTFTMDINIDDYLSGDKFDLPRLLSQLGWDLYDMDGMHTYNNYGELKAATRVDNGIETQFYFGSVNPAEEQFCGFTLKFVKPHAQGDPYYETEPYYSIEDCSGNYELYDVDMHYDEHEIEYYVKGFGITDSLNYGLSYSDIVILVYALSFASDSNNAGKNPFIYTTLEGSAWDSSYGCTVFYDMP